MSIVDFYVLSIAKLTGKSNCSFDVREVHLIEYNVFSNTATFSNLTSIPESIGTGLYERGLSFIVHPVESISYDLGRQATGSEPMFLTIKSTGLFGGAS